MSECLYVLVFNIDYGFPIIRTFRSFKIAYSCKHWMDSPRGPLGQDYKTKNNNIMLKHTSYHSRMHSLGWLQSVCMQRWYYNGAVFTPFSICTHTHTCTRWTLCIHKLYAHFLSEREISFAFDNCFSICSFECTIGDTHTHTHHSLHHFQYTYIYFLTLFPIIITIIIVRGGHDKKKLQTERRKSNNIYIFDFIVIIIYLR